MGNVDEINIDDDKFDIYIRMNSNFDHDYCFQVTKSTTFRDLIKIFTTLPVMLNQSIFYDRIPIGFKVSHFPGQITRTGGILFGVQGDFEEYLENVQLNDLVADKTLPGQLVIPVFRHRDLLHYSVIVVLCLWLYTDLPDIINPTPGYTVTNSVALFMKWFIGDIMGKKQKGLDFYNELMEPVSIIGQYIYFSFHVVKVLVTYFILWAGLLNPYSFKFEKPKVVEREELIEIGWTGAKKVSSQVFQDEYRKRVIAREGGIMKAYQNGCFGEIKNSVMELGEGEGYDSQKDVKGAQFKITKQMLLDQEKLFASSLRGKTSDEASDKIKEFRQYGPFTRAASWKKPLDDKFLPRDLELQNSSESKKQK